MNPKSNTDILIENAMVLSMKDATGPMKDAYVSIRGDRIESVGSMSELTEDFRADKVIDADGGLVMPGLVNAHVHGAMTIFRGLADDLPLMTWLNEHIFPAEAAHLSEETVYWGTRLACAEMLLCGTTALADGYFLEDAAARAFNDSGLRAVVGQGVIDFPAPGVPDPSRNVETAAEFIDKWLDNPLVTPSVFCHSPYTCSPETLTRAKDMAREKGVIFQIHVSETSAEVDQIVKERGMRPVEYLDSLGILDDKTLAVHCVHLEPHEVDILAERGTPAVICIESNMKLASGLAPVTEMVEKGVVVALGTDGPASNNDLNLFSEMRTLALVAKAKRLDPTVLPASRVISMAVDGGASALGWAEISGRIEAGCKADIIILNVCPPNLKPMYNPCSHLVYAATGREVKTVLVDGRVLLENGRTPEMDLDEIMAKVREIARRVKG